MTKKALNTQTKDGAALKDRVRHLWRELSVSERRVAEHVLNTHPNVAFETVNSVATEAGTSARSVMRFIQKLGYPGFPQLQAELRSDIERRLSSPASRFRYGKESGQRDDARTESLKEAAENLQSVISLEPSDVRLAAQMLAQTRGSLLMFGAGKALAIATYLWFHLILIKPRSLLLQGSELEILDRLMDLGPDDLIVLFEFRRYPRLGSIVASLASQRKARLLVISDAATSPAAISANEVLVVRTVSHSLLDSYVGAIALTDLLAELTIRELPEKSLATRLELYDQLTSRADIFSPGGKRSKSGARRSKAANGQ
jgi:DNA-binding MurR/RpiR family transcriptional regulator